jgi:hypothetical protein
MARKRNFDKDLRTLFYINSIVLILILSILNLLSLKKKEIKVLGAETTDNTFWEEFVAKHPTYRDGWVELGRMDKVKQIDPNYHQP